MRRERQGQTGMGRGDLKQGLLNCGDVLDYLRSGGTGAAANREVVCDCRQGVMWRALVARVNGGRADSLGRNRAGVADLRHEAGRPLKVCG